MSVVPAEPVAYTSTNIPGRSAPPTVCTSRAGTLTAVSSPGTSMEDDDSSNRLEVSTSPFSTVEVTCLPRTSLSCVRGSSGRRAVTHIRFSKEEASTTSPAAMSLFATHTSTCSPPKRSSASARAASTCAPASCRYINTQTAHNAPHAIPTIHDFVRLMSPPLIQVKDMLASDSGTARPNSFSKTHALSAGISQLFRKCVQKPGSKPLKTRHFLAGTKREIEKTLQKPGRNPARRRQKTGRPDGPAKRGNHCQKQNGPRKTRDPSNVWWSLRDLNPRPSACKALALPLRQATVIARMRLGIVPHLPSERNMA